MCARFSLVATGDQIASLFGLDDAVVIEPRYNIPPTSSLASVVEEEGRRVLRFMRWGLVPGWMKEIPKSPMINARADTVAEKPMFRGAFKYRRCVIPASGYFEWKTTSKGKQPYFIHYSDGTAMAFAGLFEFYEDGVHALESCAMITTEASSRTCEIHDRMPVLLSSDDIPIWLSTAPEESRRLLALLQPSEDERIVSFPVDKRVGNPRFDFPEAILPVGSSSLFD